MGGWSNAVVRAIRIAVPIALALVLTSCFSSGASLTGQPTLAGGHGVITGRLVVDLEGELPPAPPLGDRPSFMAMSPFPRRAAAWLGPSTGEAMPSGPARKGEPGERDWLLAVPDDPLLPQQWNLDAIRMPQTWALLAAEGPVLTPVRVAIVDTRVCADHEDMPGSRWTGFDLLGEGAALVCPPLGAGESAHHGTLVAGLVAALGNNGLGIAPAGWAGGPYVEPVAVRVLGDSGRGTTERVAEGIRTAVLDGGARVVNLSLGTFFNDDLPGDRRAREELFAAVDEAIAAGALVVAAAGNTGGNGLASPADHPRVFAVGATDARGLRAHYSNTGELDVVAPGGAPCFQEPVLISTAGRHEYWCTAGTSIAAPHVTAAAALLMALGVESADEVAAILRFTARSVEGSGTVAYDKHREGHSPQYGWGLLDVAAAVRLRAMPSVFLARVGEGVVERAGDAVWPGPSGAFSLAAVGGEDQGRLALVAWADSDRDGRLSPGDFYGEQPVTVTGGSLNVGQLTARVYTDRPRDVVR